MNFEEIKQLTNKELAERYPFIIIRRWNNELVKNENGDYIFEIDPFTWGGWSKILMAWAEKVKPIFDQMPKEEQDGFYVTQAKEKFGTLRLYLSGYPSGPYSKITEYTSMCEYLSGYCCPICGKITTNSNGNKLLIWRESLVSFFCKKCAKKFNWKYIKSKGISDKYFKRWLHSKPHGAWIATKFFKENWRRKESDWYCRVTSYRDGVEKHLKYDCRELLKDF